MRPAACLRRVWGGRVKTLGVRFWLIVLFWVCLIISAELAVTTAHAESYSPTDVHNWISAYASKYATPDFPYADLVARSERVATCESDHFDVAVINAGDYFFPWLLAAFRDLHPGIRVRLTVGNRDELLERLANHAVDLAVMSHPPTRHEFVAEPFAPHPHVIVAAPAHPLAGKRPVPLERIAREPLITREPGSATRLAMEQAFSESGVVPRIEMEIASNETIKQAVAAGFGLGFLSAHAVQQELALGRLAVIAVKGFPVMRQWYVVHRRERRLPPVTEAFQRFVVQEGARLIRRHEKGAA